MDYEELAQVSVPPDKKAKLRAYRGVCAKLGFTMCVYFICRILNGYIAAALSGLVDQMGITPVYIIHTAITVAMAYLIPMLVTALVFKTFDNYRGRYRELYKKPRRLAHALGNFPAMYGLGYGVVVLTILSLYLISNVSNGPEFIEDLFRPTALQPSSDIASTLIMVVLLAVIAPVFEEFWVRGIIYDSLKPYGCGMAIIISSVLFGLMHGNLRMLFYTTALGFALGYIRYATGSLFVVTILHSITNSIAALLLFFLSLSEITGGENKAVNTVMNIYILAVLILIVVGVIAFIRKVPVIRKYRIENTWDEIRAGKKTALFFFSIPVIIMLVFAFNEHANNWLLNLII